MFGFDLPIWLVAFGLKAKGVFNSIVTFCSKPPGSWIAAALGVFLALWLYGNHQFNKGAAHQRQVYADQEASRKPKQAKINERIVTKYVYIEGQTKWKTKYITERVAEYVTPKDDAACPINRGFVRLHDAAAQNTIPGSPSVSDGEPSGVTLSTVAETVASNYGTANLCPIRLKAWQEWYRDQKALFEK